MIGHQSLWQRRLLHLLLMDDGQWEPVSLWGAFLLAAAVRRPGGQKEALGEKLSQPISWSDQSGHRF